VSDEPTVNIASHLPTMARRQPHTLAVVFPCGRDAGDRVRYTHLTYRQLDEESNRIARGLAAVGVERGIRTVLMVKPSLEFFSLTFALFKVGAVPVLVDPGMGVKNLGQCLAEAAPTAFIGVPKAHVARKLFGWAKESTKILITVGRRLGWGGRTLDDVRSLGGAGEALADTHADETAAILFTSGSTGVPKGAVYTHGIFAAQVESIRTVYGIEPGEIDLPTFPLFALFAPALGMTAIIPDMDPTRPAQADPRKLIEAIEDFGVTSMFGSPALIDRLGRYGAEHGVRLESLRRAISAGAPVAPIVLERFAKMLREGAEVYTPYGATEALPVCSIGSGEILADTRRVTERGGGVCVGHPVPGMDVKIIRTSDEPLPEWDPSLVLPDEETGEIVVRGPVVSEEYFHRPESNALAKMRDTVTGEIVHRMGDLGYRDASGRVWFCGRKTHRITSGDETLFTVPCEAIFNTHPHVFRSALVGVEKNGAAEPVLCVELEHDARVDRKRLRDELLSRAQEHEHTRSIRRILFHPSFPVDIRHNAKIFREKLAVWATERHS